MKTKDPCWIDPSKIPVDTLVDCDFLGQEKTLLFKGVGDSGYFLVASTPESCAKSKHHYDLLAEKIRISAENKWLAWLGGDRQVPSNCMVDIIRRDGKIIPNERASSFIWKHNNGPRKLIKDHEIIAYRLLESPWQNRRGVR